MRGYNVVYNSIHRTELFRKHSSLLSFLRILSDIIII